MLRRVVRFEPPQFISKVDPEKTLARWRRSYQNNKKKRIARNAEWRKRNPEKLRAQRDRYNAKRRKGD